MIFQAQYKISRFFSKNIKQILLYEIAEKSIFFKAEKNTLKMYNLNCCSMHIHSHSTLLGCM